MGISATCTGTTRSATTAMKRTSRPGKLTNANAYAASAAINTSRTVVGTVISTVFHNESGICESSPKSSR